MNPRLTWYPTTVLHLSLEDYHNAGLSNEKTREVIENICDPGSPGALKLRCEASGINGNWNVRTQLTDRRNLQMLAWDIESALRFALFERNLPPRPSFEEALKSIPCPTTL